MFAKHLKALSKFLECEAMDARRKKQWDKEVEAERCAEKKRKQYAERLDQLACKMNALSAKKASQKVQRHIKKHPKDKFALLRRLKYRVKFLCHELEQYEAEKRVQFFLDILHTKIELTSAELSEFFLVLSREEQTAIFKQKASSKNVYVLAIYSYGITFEVLIAYCLRVVYQEMPLLQKIYSQHKNKAGFLSEVLSAFKVGDTKQRIAAITLLLSISWSESLAPVLQELMGFFSSWLLDKKADFIVELALKDPWSAVIFYQSQALEQPIVLLNAIDERLPCNAKERPYGARWAFVSQLFLGLQRISGYLITMAYYKNFSPDLQYGLLEAAKSPQRTELALRFSQKALDEFEQRLNTTMAPDVASLLLRYHPALIKKPSPEQKRAFLSRLNPRQVCYLFHCLSVQWFVDFLSDSFSLENKAQKSVVQRICSYLPEDARGELGLYFHGSGPKVAKCFAFLGRNNVVKIGSKRQFRICFQEHRRSGR